MNALQPRRGHADSANAQPSLRECVERAVRQFLDDIDDHPVNDMHEMVLREVETPLFAEVMRHYEGNQTRAAEALGINRATLRKKLRLYGLA